MTTLPAWARRDMREICDHVVEDKSSAPRDVLIARKAEKLKAWLAPRRKNEKQRATRKLKDEGSLRSRLSTAEVRAAVMKRADGKCEGCGYPKGEKRLAMDHFLGGAGRRKERESVETCWALCTIPLGGCNAERTENIPSAAYWNAAFRRHCLRHGYDVLAHVEHAELPGRARAMNPYVIKSECDVCGGVAYARPPDDALSWRGVRLRHVDPEECAAVLEVARRRFEAAQPRPEDLGPAPHPQPRGEHHE